MGGRASGRRRDRVRASAPRVPIVVLIAAFVLQAWGAPALGQVDAASEASAPPVSVPTRAPASTAPAAASVDAAPRPDIVVIYMDDFSPVVQRLWSRRSRTPALARLVREGVTLNAVASTPLCCPARGNLLTGRYGHRNGVTANDVGGFDPGETVAPRLQGAGYHTAFVGKFLNGFARRARTAQQVRPFARGWDEFDVVWENQGHFYDYRLWTGEGVRYHGRSPADHSSVVAGERAARRIREAPPDQPLFMIVSLYEGHAPFLPMKRFEDDRRCAEVRPWKSPAFDEARIGDKPRYVRDRPRLGRRSWPLRNRCEAILTVDWVTQRVQDALQETGRLDDTLLILTADNGIMLGEHRLRTKGFPYATPVPMHATWPARWGTSRRTIEEPVSNVDLAPTFCRLAGCSIEADGRDLTDLLDGSVDRIDRLFVYEEMLHPERRRPGTRPMPAWYGIRTTKGYSDTPWVYTEYATGERELYDLSTDPHQLRNLARDPRFAPIRRELRALLHEGVVGPRAVGFRERPYQ